MLIHTVFENTNCKYSVRRGWRTARTHVYVAVWSRPSSPLNNQRLYRGMTHASFSNMLCLHKGWAKFLPRAEGQTAFWCVGKTNVQ